MPDDVDLQGGPSQSGDGGRRRPDIEASDQVDSVDVGSVELDAAGADASERKNADDDDEGGTDAELDPAFERLLNFLKESRAFDFTGYKRPSLARRVRYRMRELGIDS